MSKYFSIGAPWSTTKATISDDGRQASFYYNDCNLAMTLTEEEKKGIIEKLNKVLGGEWNVQVTLVSRCEGSGGRPFGRTFECKATLKS